LVALQVKKKSHKEQKLVLFNTNSYSVGVDNHASQCMGNYERLFENLTPFTSASCVGKIEGGLQIKGQGMFISSLNENKGHTHCIKIPNSLYVHGLKMCLLLPQHQVQEAGDNYPLPHGTRMKKKCQQLHPYLGAGLLQEDCPL
jgi:hypothetical protein